MQKAVPGRSETASLCTHTVTVLIQLSQIFLSDVSVLKVFGTQVYFCFIPCTFVERKQQRQPRHPSIICIVIMHDWNEFEMHGK